MDSDKQKYDNHQNENNFYDTSKRKLLKMDKNCIKNLCLSDVKDNSSLKIKRLYTTNIEGLKRYNFELNNGKMVQLALNSEIEKLVNIFLKNNM